MNSFFFSFLRQLKDKIEKLGGTVCGEESSMFDPSCTHLICSKLNQSEKTLSIMASGRWLLCPAYIEDSFEADHFLNVMNNRLIHFLIFTDFNFGFFFSLSFVNTGGRI